MKLYLNLIKVLFKQNFLNQNRLKYPFNKYSNYLIKRNQSNDVHKVIRYIELKRHIYDDIEPENKFEFKAVTNNKLSSMYSKIFDDSFAVEEKCNFNGEFEIDGKFYGKITNKNLDEIIKISKKAYFGKDDKTVYDENIRYAKEIEGSRIKIINFNIDKILDSLNKKFGKKLSATLYKLVIYEKYGHFSSHKDSVHRNEHIATLLIGLPIDYEGGILNISYPNDENKFKSFKLYNNLVAFYTDCEHSISMVEKGTRIVLQYDLSVVSDLQNEEKKKKKIEKLNPDVINELIKHKKPLEKSEQFNSYWINELKEELLKNDFNKKKFAFLLRHEYASKILNGDLLKGTDKAIFDNFKIKFDVDLRYLILDIEKFVELDLFYIKCKAFKRETIQNEQNNDDLNQEEDEENNKVKLSEEIALEIKKNQQENDEDEKLEKDIPIRIELVLTDQDKCSLVEKKKLTEFTGNDAEQINEYIYFTAAIFVNGILKN